MRETDIKKDKIKGKRKKEIDRPKKRKIEREEKREKENVLLPTMQRERKFKSRLLGIGALYRNSERMAATSSITKDFLSNCKSYL